VRKRALGGLRGGGESHHVHRQPHRRRAHVHGGAASRLWGSPRAATGYGGRRLLRSMNTYWVFQQC
jgi:hypothetical protein